MIGQAGVGILIVCLTWLAIFPLQHWLKRQRILDVPNARSLHNRPVPRGGGVAIVLVTLGGTSIQALAVLETSLLKLVAYAAGALILAGVSWADDVRTLPFMIRLAIQSLAALIVMFGIGVWHTVVIPFVGQVHLGWLSAPITFAWIVGLTNAYNFMDGIDGIAGGQAVVAGIGWAVIGAITDQSLITAIGILLAATSLGFLQHNWPPARIFMGDVGSAFLGYSFATLSVMATQSHGTMAIVGGLLLWPFVFDTTLTFLRRLSHGENVFEAHRTHLYQRLVASGVTHRSVALRYLGLASIGVTLATLWTLQLSWISPFLAVSMPLLCLCLWCSVVRQERLTARSS